MPIKSTPVKKQRPVRTPKPKNKALIITLAILLPIVVVGGGLFAIGYWVINGPAIAKQEKMAQYLENKYGEKFVVNRPRLANGGLGVDGVWKTTAHPEKDSSLSFDIGGAQDAHVDGFSDQYVAAVWSKEEDATIKQRISQLFGSNTDISSSVKITLSDKLVYTATLTSPTLSEAKKDTNGFAYGLTLNLDKVSSSIIASDTDKITQLINDIREEGVLHYFFLDYKVNTTDGHAYDCKAALSKSQFYTKDIINECLMGGNSKWLQQL